MDGLIVRMAVEAVLRMANSNQQTERRDREILLKATVSSVELKNYSRLSLFYFEKARKAG